ncbi:MAG: class I SAM-dependent methyltransferase [Cardiobacteriaceae bacterium]|nr:class I SAM-dependent methyltransferase [Cardiobacteriaceae bacterium]
MDNKIANTLFIPFAARIFAAEHFSEYFNDKTAIQLKSHIPQKFLKISSQYEMIASAARYHISDKKIQQFIDKNGECNIINLGAGLETVAFRIDNKNAIFYQIDLSEVIQFRQQILPPNNNEILIAASMLDTDWYAKIDKNKPTLFIANGVFMYFYEQDILNLIHNIKQNFKNAELIFDATTKFGVKCANFYVSRFGEDMAKMYFYINKLEEFATKSQTQILSSQTFFTEARQMLWHKVNFITKFNMWLVDTFNLSYIIHLDLK